MALIDTHTHLDFPQFDHDREEVIARSLAAGVEIIVNVGADLASSRASVALAEQYPAIYAAVGVHPHDAKAVSERELGKLRELATHPKVVAIGEIGLDFYRDLSPREVQRQVFRQQLALAAEIGKPVIIHDREAHGEVGDILRGWIRDLPAHSPLARHPGTLHCFSGDLEMAKEMVELGFFIGVDGPLTYLNARRLPEIVRALPLECLLIETDAPYLPPHPYRGQRNEPAHVRLVAEAIAHVKTIPLDEVARTTTNNARVLFGLHHQEEDYP
ncbi:MAG: TatD family hydrolase [Anaerolineae bacterium]|nr:TatD family hydrolase [Anaerolineae bacterium]MDH7474133.1 TatD family hydrolase [Anaerolineae bacterium]